MKNENRFYKLLLRVALIAGLCFFLPEVKAQTGHTQKYDSLKNGGKLLIRDTNLFKIDPSIQIAELCRITWEDGKLDIHYFDSTKVTDAIKKFFEWVKGYMENDFYVLRKDEYQFTDGWKFELYFKEKGKK